MLDSFTTLYIIKVLYLLFLHPCVLNVSEPYNYQRMCGRLERRLVSAYFNSSVCWLEFSPSNLGDGVILWNEAISPGTSHSPVSRWQLQILGQSRKNGKPTKQQQQNTQSLPIPFSTFIKNSQSLCQVFDSTTWLS